MRSTTSVGQRAHWFVLVVSLAATGCSAAAGAPGAPGPGPSSSGGPSDGEPEAGAGADGGITADGGLCITAASCGPTCGACAGSTNGNGTAVCEAKTHTCAVDCVAGYITDGAGGCAKLLSGAPALAAGPHHTCALLAGGNVKCWGSNNVGQVGDGTMLERDTPVAVQTSHVVAIAAGDAHTCTLLDTGTMQCWGYNDAGQLGTSISAYTLGPAAVDGLDHVTAIAVGGSHTCALRSTGAVKCWGSNAAGQLGNGSASTVTMHALVDVQGLSSGVVAIAAGGARSCALMATGTVKCWGSGYPGPENHAPVDVTGLPPGVRSIVSAGGPTCALLQSGGVKCWGGSNFAGQLGNQSTTPSAAPVDVQSLSASVTSLALGGGHSCALLATGAVKCWGANDSGQLGNNAIVDSQLAAVDVQGLSSGVTAIAANFQHTCALLTNGQARCWGSNDYGVLGSGTANSKVPVAVVGIP